MQHFMHAATSLDDAIVSAETLPLFKYHLRTFLYLIVLINYVFMFELVSHHILAFLLFMCNLVHIMTELL